MISREQYDFLKKQGISKEQANKQLELLAKGTVFSKLHKPATPGDGIIQLTAEETDSYIRHFVKHKNEVAIVKFVPASGAATRMFKEANEYLQSNEASAATQYLVEHFEELPFAQEVPNDLNSKAKLNYILTNLKYASKPKALIPFHLYGTKTKTAFEEHWVEAGMYAIANGKAQVHFTISEVHKTAFEEVINSNKPAFEQSYGINLNIEFSTQRERTNTLCVKPDDGTLMTDKANKPILRPGGHGALLNNLQQLKAELVFIKNIDNVTHLDKIGPTLRFKKALAGYLLTLKDKVFSTLLKIDQKAISLTELEHLSKSMQLNWPTEYLEWSASKKYNFWHAKLNRPLRVCGMVKNEGEPGGGPFWVHQKDGTNSLQIVESAQINTDDPVQLDIVSKATHFNPVDIVCFLKDYKGNSFNLEAYVDETSSFITSKVVESQECKVLEHPGLWNGGMADWLTIFIEVDIVTFNPVKTVNDLLKSAHHGTV